MRETARQSTNGHVLRITDYVSRSIGRSRQRAPTGDLAADEHNFRPDVIEGIVIAIEVALQENVAFGGDLAECPVTRLLHRGAFVQPDRLHAVGARLILENLRR